MLHPGLFRFEGGGGLHPGLFRCEGRFYTLVCLDVRGGFTPWSV